ncbi:leishmanolysin-like peptidase isoform X1 [Xiphophorus couchianus]|uniref:leishmanolysin-like peptidase isoform X1 n=1 Tax=Xiphophorus couchianus TaxID=32473 RepID=UPI001015F932|nr:leishmanolysin-like peptidase isoform X1 [Xiphophorus couchianus]
MERWLRVGGEPSVSRCLLGPVLVLSLLAVQASCHRTCTHTVPSGREVVHQVYLKPERLAKRSSPDDLQLKIKIVYDSSVDQLPADKRRLVKDKLFPQAIDYLQRAFSLRRRVGPVLLSRQCATNQYMRKRGDPHRYCQDACADVTRCGPVVVPQHHLQQCKVCSESGKSCGPAGPPDGPGVEGSDFVLYVSGITTERCGQENIVAYAAYCQLEAELDRPIAGYANLCPAMISSQPQEFEGMLSTVKHEIIHALGFSAGLFAFYHDDEGKPLTPRFASGLPAFNESLGLYQWSEAVIRRVSRLWDIRGGEMVRHHVHVLVTPRVVEEARRHFSCPILEGMELENQGGTGTELNHWEKRLLEVRTFSPTPLRFTKRQTNPTCSFLLVIPHDSLQNEAMTGSHTQNRVFSRLTLAIMEDSGWYRANYSLAQRLDWGHGLGCDFVMKSCKFWMDRQRQRRHPVTPFCDTVRASPLQLTCRQDQLAVAVCNLQKYPQQLPLEYQYFDWIPDVAADQLSSFGGAVEIADFCPFSQEFSWHLSGEYQRNSYCRVSENQPDSWRNYGAEQYGLDSVCLYQKSAFVMEQCTRKMTYPDWGSGCYKVSCSSQGLTVYVQDRSFLCMRKGQQLSVSVRVNDWVYNGVLLCPACADFCDDCPLPHQLLPINASRSNPIDPCSSSPGLAITLWLLLLNLLPLMAGLLICHWS